MKLQILIVLLVFIWGILLYSQSNENQQNNELREEKSSLTSNLSYKEAENLLSSPIMEENHIMINESLVSINESLKSLEKITSNLSLIPTNNYTFPSFLNNENNSSLKIAKSDIELYTSKYQQLLNKANYITELAFKSIKNSSELINDLQKEMIKLKSEIEKVLKDLCLPLILNEKLNDYNSTNKTRNLFAIEPIYRDNINELGLLMNDGFSFCKSSFDNLGNMTEEIYDYAKFVETQTKEATSTYEEILNTINDTNLHDKLISSKKSFTELKAKIEESQKEFEAEYQTFENTYYNNIINLEEFNKNYNEIAGNIKTIHGEIIDKISKEEKESDQFKVYKNDLYIPPLISYDLINKIGVLEKQLIDSQNEIKKGIEEMKNITNIEAITSLDLLFIIDITYSMDFYLEEAKKNIINIINGIISGCPGIDINLGFIGYRDFEEFEVGNYTDIDFTQNYTYVQKVIEDVWADGGGDLAEDIAGAFEMALNKTWKSNARFAMLIADAPCHGKICYYGYYNDDYSNGVPGQRNITDIVEELADNKISLFCLRIWGDTERMFNMFKNIYKKHKNIGFNIFSKTDIEQDFIDLIVESASEVYENQRYIDDEKSI